MGKASNGRTEGVGVACAAVQQHASVDWGGRKKLPAPAISRNNFSVWTFLKQCIGKELSKITMPVVFNEPLSFLQRLAEGMEYISLLDKACDCDDAVDRIQYVTAYYVSMVASSEGRFAKPFNPLLGETYELERLDNGFRVLLEQVSHHPPISALQAESTTGRYKLQGSVHPKLKFWGKSIEINPDGQLTIELTERNEVYQLNHVNCVVHNVIFGDMWIEQVGQLQVTNLRTRHKAALNFRPVGWFGKDLHKLDGYIYNERKEKRVALFGKWTSALYSADVKTYESYNSKKKDSHRHSKYSDESDSQIADIPQCPNAKLLWRRDPLPPNAEQAYLFSEFALTLNEFTDEMRAKLPQTDSRLRDDVRRLEHGDIDGAADNKLILEEKQRATRKLMHSNKEVWCNRWFKEGPNPHTGVPDWLPTERCYWDRDWSGCPDIF
ncbi:PREDICTED: oxysterol-binding protein-related protein 1-like [Priapulus caudatus]|uniref:Oxysterol-binding protein n=1 Tax=Priapulus caudatus TaxID=37621 RepID=A0ABM1F8I2_PRICU|nr:PREDICTED: oxysterol-binding protein-related protein 1-like [Priapulus caudatus]